MIDPIDALRQATDKIPELKFAWGIVGLVAAATAAVMLANNDPKTAFFYFGYAVCGTFLIAILAKNLDLDTSMPARLVVWVVTICFALTIIFTMTAYAFGLPCNWASFVGATPACIAKNEVTSSAPATPQQSPASEPIVRSFELSDRSDDCAVRRTRTVELCLQTGAKVTSWSGPLIESANCGSSISNVRRIPDRPNCIAADVNLIGCGYDKILGIKNCRGRGWIEGKISLEGRL